ncbi:MAG: Severe Depolymerization of Actin [Alyxoria varia]|nr:MAG: Severe Depolymerization of Actin [Alyxoria varia]
MVKRKFGALEKIEADLPNLRHKIRRDPLSYKHEFEDQYQQYFGLRSIVGTAPGKAATNELVSLRDIIDFISHVAHLYPDLASGFPKDLESLLIEQHADLQPELREKLVTSLVLLRKKGMLDSASLINVLFPILISTPSKSLRSLLYQKVLTDIRASNSKVTNHKLNRTIQTTLHNLLASDKSSPKAIWAMRITRELWRRQVWTDAKAVEIMKEAALADNVKVVVGGVNFFLGGDREREEAAEESSENDEAIDMRQLKHQAGINKKSKKREKELKTAAATVRRKERKAKQPHALNFTALHLLHDPQGFAEALFSRHLQSTGKAAKLNLDQKLLVLQLVSRLVGLHKLHIPSLYSYFLKFLVPRQVHVTSFMASLAQATHNLVPPDDLEPLIQKIANEFVSEAAAGQVAAAGLNAIREVCTRQPLAMNDTLLQDLVMYRKSKDKGVMAAAKGLLSLYRDVGPNMLRKRDRGRDAAMGLRSGERRQRRYGEEQLGVIEGLDLLEKYKEDERKKKQEEKGLQADEDGTGEKNGADEEDDWNAWVVEDEEDSDDSGGWIDVESDGDDIDISDSDDETNRGANKRKDQKQKIDNESETQTTEDRTFKPATQEQDTAANANGSVETGISPVPTIAGAQDQSDAQAEMAHLSNLATTRILTPADLAKLNELRRSAAVQSLMHTKKNAKHHSTEANTTTRSGEDPQPVTGESLATMSNLGHRATKEEKVAAAKGMKDEEKQKHASRTAKRKEFKQEHGKSSTNKEKERKKNFLMTIGKAKGKNKRSLREVGKVLKGHKDRSKRGGKRGNRG